AGVLVLRRGALADPLSSRLHMSRFVLLFAWVLLAVLPDAASACSVCYGGDEASRKAFLFTTVLLSMLPIGMIVGLGWWVWSSTREVGDPSGGSDPKDPAISLD